MADIMLHMSLARYAESRQKSPVPRLSLQSITYNPFMSATALSVTMQSIITLVRISTIACSLTHPFLVRRLSVLTSSHLTNRRYEYPVLSATREPEPTSQMIVRRASARYHSRIMSQTRHFLPNTPCRLASFGKRLCVVDLIIDRFWAGMLHYDESGEGLADGTDVTVVSEFPTTSQYRVIDQLQYSYVGNRIRSRCMRTVTFNQSMNGW